MIPADINARLDLIARITDPGYRRKLHPIPQDMRFLTQMKKNNGHIPRRRGVTDYATAAMEQIELYCAGHPGSPSAVRRPRLMFRSELWIALLGPSMEEGIVGIGPTVVAALRAFDTQYFASLPPPSEAATQPGVLRQLRKALPAARHPRRNLKAAAKSGMQGSARAWPC
jgi:hypothetical protein